MRSRNSDVEITSGYGGSGLITTVAVTPAMTMLTVTIALLLQLFAAETISSGACTAIGARADFNIRKLSGGQFLSAAPILSFPFNGSTQLRAARGDNARASMAFLGG